MKLYYHPVSTTCRPIMLFAAESGIDLEFELVDLFKGEQLGEAYCAINPSRQVPVLEDGDFRLTESASILRYLADKIGAAAYPKEPEQRARVNERMDWFNTGLYRDLGYGLIYPQVLPHLKRADEKVQAATLAWGRQKSRIWLSVLDEKLIGPRNAFACGDSITLADYLGAAFLTVGEVIRLDYTPWPNVKRWLDGMKARPSWSKVNEGFYAHFVAPYASVPFEGL
jgi:glutathione S-transferase